MNEIENDKMLSDAQLSAMGLPRLAYVKPIIVEGVDRFAIHQADGTMLAILDSREEAFVAAVQNDMLPVNVH